MATKTTLEQRQLSFQGVLEEGIAIGRQEGRADGYEEGYAEGAEAGTKHGVILGRRAVIVRIAAAVVGPEAANQLREFDDVDEMERALITLLQ